MEMSPSISSVISRQESRNLPSLLEVTWDTMISQRPPSQTLVHFPLLWTLYLFVICPWPGQDMLHNFCLSTSDKAASCLRSLSREEKQRRSRTPDFLPMGGELLWQKPCYTWTRSPWWSKAVWPSITVSQWSLANICSWLWRKVPRTILSWSLKKSSVLGYIHGFLLRKNLE